ncbi:helix-turn-helix domain-containing protein [Acuticoccus sp. M5D2P5]|uniref:helix-turn-helix domain-containing protein n=1 Tax=Acuticoccus kalidii TaxID=2910977 RepID=UPI001F1C8C97|nr:helix-turn-helix domain-containing protein [Acuticoccus kalidii]MCF3932876.1 helix-turn-helix domain-containing protein [Acuticoccus kalidii]
MHTGQRKTPGAEATAPRGHRKAVATETRTGSAKKSQGSARRRPRTAEEKALAALHTKKVRAALLKLIDTQSWTVHLQCVWEDLINLFVRHQGEIYPSNARLASKRGMSVRFISKARGLLVKFGLIEVVSHAKGGRGKAPVLRLGRVAMAAISKRFKRGEPSFADSKRWNEVQTSRGSASTVGAKRDVVPAAQPVEAITIPDTLPMPFWARLRPEFERAAEALGFAPVTPPGSARGLKCPMEVTGWPDRRTRVR